MNALPKRTIKEAIDLDTMEGISSDLLLANGMDYYHSIRHQATERHIIAKSDRYVCAQCGHGVYITTRNRRPLWQHFRGAPRLCPWWTGDGKTVDQVSASQFNGQQESPLHRKIKTLISDILKGDVSASNVLVETTIVGTQGKRRPDVQSTYNGRRVAFEIQLATTQIPIILGREDFYKNEGMYLIWLTWKFEERPIEEIQQSFKDVYYRHHKNIFSIDDETIGLSYEMSKLIIRAHSCGAKGWKNKLVELSDLTWPESGLPFAFLVKTNEDLRREKWLQTINPDSTWTEKDLLIRETAQEADLPCNIDLNIEDIGRVINCILSLKEGRPIGTREANLYAYANTFLNAAGRYRYANVFEHFARRFGQLDVLQRETVKRKLQLSKNSAQMAEGDPDAKIIRLFFGDWGWSAP